MHRFKNHEICNLVGNLRLTHPSKTIKKFPVDISIPLSRVSDVSNIVMEVDKFDFKFYNDQTFLHAEITVHGLTSDDKNEESCNSNCCCSSTTETETEYLVTLVMKEEDKMNEKWIGEEVNTSGTYVPTITEELTVRKGGYAQKVYCFKTRFRLEYYISDKKAIVEIEEFIKQDQATSLIDFLYKLVIDHFGSIDLLVAIEHKIAHERDLGYRRGKQHMQQEFRNLLGI